MTRLREAGEVTEAGVTLTWTEGQASALDGRDIAKSKEVGTVRVKDANGKDLAHDVMFAFAYHAFWPNGEWMLGGG
jgi:carboxypeptidase C (cathepsin A)